MLCCDCATKVGSGFELAGFNHPKHIKPRNHRLRRLRGCLYLKHKCGTKFDMFLIVA
jgi:hypothetical protein